MEVKAIDSNMKREELRKIFEENRLVVVTKTKKILINKHTFRGNIKRWKEVMEKQDFNVVVDYEGKSEIYLSNIKKGSLLTHLSIEKFPFIFEDL